MKNELNWRIHQGSSFNQYSDEWDRLNNSGPNSPVLNSAFVSSALDAFGDGSEKLAILESGGDIVAMTMLEKKKFGVWDTYQPSQAPLGFWINRSTIPLVDLLRSLARSLPGIVLKIGLTQQDPNIYIRPKDGKCISTLDYIDTANVKITGTFDDYWAARGKNLRHNLKRQRNRLNKENIDITLHTLTDPDSVHEAIRVYAGLESIGWKSKQGTAVHTDNDQGKFYINLLKSFFSRGKGRIYQYAYNGRVVATDLCVEQGGILVILKTTYDENIRTSSPAFLMRQEVFRKLFNEARLDSIEFYGKVMDWHTKWSNESRKIYHINYSHISLI